MAKLRALTAEERVHAAKTLSYEVSMMLESARMLDRWGLGEGSLRNAVLESFLVHVRQLIEFLSSMEPRRDRDILAAHFCDPMTAWQGKADEHREALVAKQPDGSDSLKERADREVVHLTLERGGPHKTAWPTAAIASDLIDRLGEFAAEYGCLLDSRVRRSLIQRGPPDLAATNTTT